MPSASHRPRTTKDASTFPSPQLLQQALSTPRSLLWLPPRVSSGPFKHCPLSYPEPLAGPGRYRGAHTSSFSTLNKGFISQSRSLLHAPVRSAPQDSWEPGVYLAERGSPPRPWQSLLLTGGLSRHHILREGLSTRHRGTSRDVGTITLRPRKQETANHLPRRFVPGKQLHQGPHLSCGSQVSS